MVFVKKNIRSSFRSNRRSNYSKNNESFSKYKLRGSGSGRGNITQLYDKYLKLAKEAFSSGDRIQAEYFNQFADHYSRLITEQGLKSLNSEKISYVSNENATDISVKESAEINVKDSSLKINESKDEGDSIDESEDIDKSIESVPFIAKAVKKTVKSKK